MSAAGKEQASCPTARSSPKEWMRALGEQRRQRRNDAVHRQRTVEDVKRRREQPADKADSRPSPSSRNAKHSDDAHPALAEEVADVKKDRERDRLRRLFRKAETSRETHSASRFFERFVDEHHRDVADDRVDAVALHALQALLDDQLFAAQLVAELVAHRGPPRLGQAAPAGPLPCRSGRPEFERADASAGCAHGGARVLPSPASTLKVLHLAAGNRWTGAAAPAFAETEALRQAGHRRALRVCRRLQTAAKIGHHDFAHPIIAKAQNPLSFARTVRGDRAAASITTASTSSTRISRTTTGWRECRHREERERSRANVSRAARAARRSAHALADRPHGAALRHQRFLRRRAADPRTQSRLHAAAARPSPVRAGRTRVRERYGIDATNCCSSRSASCRKAAVSKRCSEPTRS